MRYTYANWSLCLCLLLLTQAPVAQPISRPDSVPLKVTARSFEPRQPPHCRSPFGSVSNVIKPPSSATMPPQVLGRAGYGEQPSVRQTLGSSESGHSHLMADAPEYHTVESRRSNSTAPLPPAPAKEDSAHQLEIDSRSSTSENSSIHAFEVTTATN